MHSYDTAATRCSAHELKERLELKDRLPIVYTGTFESYQGLDLLVGSAKIVKEYHPEILFVLVGGKPQQIEHWQIEARKHDVEDCLLFLGIVPPAEALDYLEMAEILISPRVGGTSVPLKIYSYLHVGKPIIATDLLAHTQVLNNEIALLVAPTGEELADGILRLVRSPDLRRRLGHRAQQHARQRFDPANYLAKIAWIYQELKPSTSILEPVASSSPSVSAHSQNQPAASTFLNPEN
jgi:glycosyltransferase involved in cell wall biosynthesis